MVNKRIAIIGALDQEIEEFLNHMSQVEKKEEKGFTFYEGRLNEKEIVVVKSGVGKVFGAMTAQKLIDKYDPVCIIFTGIAGALNPTFEIGDVVISADSMQHDMDVTPLGFSIGTIPYTNLRIFAADNDLKDLAISAKTSYKIHAGRILTGDQFIADKDKFEKLKELEGDAIEMEGAAVAQVCVINNVPFVIIRTISDKADHSATVNFNEFLPKASKNSFEIVDHILKNTNYGK